MIAQQAEIDLLKQEIARLEKLAYTDQLTGLANRRKFDETIESEWKRGIRSQSPLSILLIDIDHFKRYNDTQGHIAGDQLLQALATAWASIGLRQTDLCARFGGEEFVVILPDTTAPGAMRVAERISDSARQCGVTVSIGVVAFVPEQDYEPSDLIKEADCALYQAKEQGRDRVVVGMMF